MNKVAIYTAIYGFHDTLKPTIKIPGVDWICFTDGSVNSVSGAFPHKDQLWTEIRTLRGRFSHPRMSAKWIRMNPELLLPEYDTTIWIDASFTITNKSFVKWIQEMLDRSYGFVLYGHPERGDIYSECAVSETMPKYAGEPMREQVEYYRSQGLPEDHGLWATGILGRHKNRIVESINQRWMNENIRWSWQDQLSLPYVLWLHRSAFAKPDGHKPVTLPGSVYGSEFFTRQWVGPNR